MLWEGIEDGGIEKAAEEVSGELLALWRLSASFSIRRVSPT